MLRQPLLLASLLLAAPLVLAQPSGAIDATLQLAPDAPPEIDAPAGLVRLNDSTPGVRYLFDLTLERDHTTLEIRANGFGLDRPRQLVPSLVVPEDRYPLFHQFPNAEIWDVEGSGNVFHVSGTGDALVLRLGVAGPRNVTLVLEVDREPPRYSVGPRENLTHIGFYQETRTEELALADLHVRRVGQDEWVRNPTPEYHVLQRFPVQGLDPETEYETRVVFEDWAENQVASPIERFTTPPAPVVPIPQVRILAPEPNATLPAGAVTVRVAIDSNASPVPRHGVRVFFDLREVGDAFEYDGSEVAYTPNVALAPGLHRVSVEATNEEGGTGVARWSFTIGGERAQTPVPLWVALGAMVLALALARRR